MDVLNNIVAFRTHFIALFSIGPLSIANSIKPLFWFLTEIRQIKIKTGTFNLIDRLSVQYNLVLDLLIIRNICAFENQIAMFSFSRSNVICGMPFAKVILNG